MHPGKLGGGSEEPFDATLEEVLHLVTNGFVAKHPEAFHNQDSRLTKAMDKARGGNFKTIPSPYPAAAWYTYDDATCKYDCMAMEYFYWALTSIMGGQSKRTNISHEFKMNTHDSMKTGDKLGFSLLTDKQYKLPSKLPTGKYTATPAPLAC